MKYGGPPLTLGNAAAARVRLMVWCLDCHHRVEPDPAEMAERYQCRYAGPGLAISRLVFDECCSQCIGRVVSRTVRLNYWPNDRDANDES